MKALIVLVVYSFAVTSCNLKQLGCVICAEHSSIDTVRYQTGEIKSIVITKGVGAGLHGNWREETVTTEFNRNNSLRSEKKEKFILNYRDFGKIMLAADSLVYHLSDDSIIRYVAIYKEGKMLKTTVVRKKKLGF